MTPVQRCLLWEALRKKRRGDGLFSADPDLAAGLLCMALMPLTALGLMTAIPGRVPPPRTYTLEEVYGQKKLTRDRYTHPWEITLDDEQAEILAESFRRTFDLAEKFRREAEGRMEK